jgi:hypothetical protein
MFTVAKLMMVSIIFSTVVSFHKLSLFTAYGGVDSSFHEFIKLICSSENISNKNTHDLEVNRANELWLCFANYFNKTTQIDTSVNKVDSKE